MWLPQTIDHFTITCWYQWKAGTKKKMNQISTKPIIIMWKQKHGEAKENMLV